MLKACIVIPVYDHERSLPAVLDGLRPAGLPCLLVDDGSGPVCREALEGLQRRESSWVYLIRHESNRGKGAAMITGFREASVRGCTHVAQIDADGQHRVEDLRAFIVAAGQHPDAVIAGVPVYDSSVPKARLYGRRLTNFWARINTLSLDIRDAMCGFRIYPLAPVLELMRRVEIGERMEFDMDILVRLHWQGVPVVNIPTAVTYPVGGVSHFRMWRDNVRISATHARLFFGMLVRLPRLFRARGARA